MLTAETYGSKVIFMDKKNRRKCKYFIILNVSLILYA